MSESRKIRETLGHPVIDTDGHVSEYMPRALEYIREELTAAEFATYHGTRSPLSEAMDEKGRRAAQVPVSAWWGSASDPLDHATAMLPALLHERMDEFGIDFAVLYPSEACMSAAISDPAIRRGVVRGFNRFFATEYSPYSDRMTVAGMIPMSTPDEAIDHLQHCKSLGVRTTAIPEGVVREISAPRHGLSPWMYPDQSYWYDSFGLDSAYDYDPVWQTFVDMDYPLISHGGLGHATPQVRTSPTNYCFNHIGSFATVMQRLAKSLFFGGVTRRFPTLNIAFLECGVAWGSTLLSDIVEHWEKRNPEALEANLDPSKIDVDALMALFESHGQQFGPMTDARDFLETRRSRGIAARPEMLDDFRHLGISQKTDIRDLFVPRFFFGCEADDRGVGLAFSNLNSFGSKLQAMFSSDIAHWDVQHMNGVVAEAYGLVGKGLITPDDFRDFTFTHPSALYLGANPEFFAGTVIEQAIGGEKRVAA